VGGAPDAFLVDLREVMRLTRRFVGPFVRLGLFVILLELPFIAVAVDVTRAGHRGTWVFLVFVVVLDVAMTFMTPTLAFTTRRARTAIGEGWYAIRRFWPADRAYLFVPALAVVLVSGLTMSEAPFIVRVSLSASSTLFATAVKGATVAFFLRRVPVGDDGSAYLEFQPSPAGLEAVNP